jgi:PAS domain S-box-containing protein
VADGDNWPEGRSSSVQDPESMQRFLAMSIDLLAIADLETRVLEMSESWERVLGWSRADLLGEPLVGYVHPDDRPRVEAELAGLLVGGDAVGVDVRVRAKDGSYRWLRGSARSDLDAGRIYVTAADITRRKASEEALVRSNEELERFAYAAAHDLTAPLARIEMALAATPRPAGDGGLLVDVARRGASRMRRLIEDLLAFSAVGRAGTRPEDVDLDELLGEVLADLATAIEQSAAEVHHEPLPTAWGHRSLLGQVLQNLVSNSLKFVRDDVTPRIEITGDRDESGTTIRVADNGIGVDVAKRKEVFGVFTRLNVDDQHPGSGIGLATCAKIVAYHGGEVRLEDGIDGGLLVAVQLPPKPEGASPRGDDS